jgi:hypothetical protein
MRLVKASFFSARAMGTRHNRFFVCGVRRGGSFFIIIRDARTRVRLTMFDVGDETPDAMAALDEMAWTSTGTSANLLR